MIDTDGDNVRCRWASQTEALSISHVFPNARLDEVYHIRFVECFDRRTFAEFSSIPCHINASETYRMSGFLKSTMMYIFAVTMYKSSTPHL
jgi:hypothetical protein